MTEILSQYELDLLKSLKEGPKVVHLGRSPVSAIDTAFRLESLKFIITLQSEHSWWKVGITEAGLKRLEVND